MAYKRALAQIGVNGCQLLLLTHPKQLLLRAI